MPIACNLPYCDEDKEMLDRAARGEANVIDPEIETAIPEAEKVIAQRCVECLKENIENSKSELAEKLNQQGRGPTDLEKLDLELEPTEEEYHEQYNIGKELGMEGVEIIDYPVITGIKDPETNTHIEYVENMEIVVIDHIDIEIVKELMRETLSFLRTCKIPDEFENQAVVNMIVFVDKQELPQKKGDKKHISLGKIPSPEVLQAEPRRSRNLYVFRDRTGEFPHGERLAWVLAHEIFHINAPKIKKRFEDHSIEWINASIAQEIKKGVVGEDKDYTLSSQEDFRAQHFAAWVTDSSKLCSEMKKFFDKYFSV